MWKLLKMKFLEKKNKNKKDICKNCVWWKSEEMFYLKKANKYEHFCGKMFIDTLPYESCNNFLEELFEAKPNSIQTKEYDLNIESTIEKEKLETN